MAADGYTSGYPTTRVVLAGVQQHVYTQHYVRSVGALALAPRKGTHVEWRRTLHITNSAMIL